MKESGSEWLPKGNFKDESLHEGEESTRLSKNKAHDEANSLRAQKGMRPGSHKMRLNYPTNRGQQKDFVHYGVPRGGFEAEPTAEEYKMAFDVIDDLQNAAKTEPSTEKYELLAKRLAIRLPHALKKIITKAGATIDPHTTSHDPDAEFRQTRARSVLENDYQARLDNLKTASDILRELQKKGSKWGKWEKKQYKTK